MTAREEVLRRVRSALARSGGTSAAAVPRGYRTVADVRPGTDEAVELLVDRLVDYRASVMRCAAEDVAAVVAAELSGAASVAVPPGVPAEWRAAASAAGVDVRVDDDAAPLSAARLDQTAAVLTGCRVAIAETGTIVLDGCPDQGRRVLTLLPDRHVLVVRADQVVGSVPEAVAVLGEHPARPLTWISGPSATSDIELVRVEGVHGPRDLRVVIVM